MKKIAFLTIVSSLLLCSCKPIVAVAPEIEVAQELEIPNQPLSSINIPIKVNLKPYFKDTEKSIPKKFTGDEQVCEGVSYAYSFYRDPIDFKGTGKDLTFNVDGEYSLKLNYCPKCSDLFASSSYCVTPRIYTSCGIDEPRRKVAVSYSTEIGVGKDYHLTSKTKLNSIKAKSPCKITIFEYNATETLEEELTKALKDVEKDIDKEIEAINLKPEMEKTWKALIAPSNLEGYGFLYLNPSKMSISDITYKGDTAYFNAVLHARPKIYSSEQEIKTNTLPNLSNYKTSNGFDVSMDIFAQYDSISSILNKNIGGTSVEIKGREVIFGNISVYGASNKQLSIKVDFTGKKKGTIYLIGTPVFDAKEQYISFPDMTFDLKSKDALLKSAKWLFDKKITDAIRTSSAVDLKPYLATLKETMNESLKMEIDKGVYMDGRIKTIDIDYIQPKEKELFIRINSKGTLSIKM